MQICRENFEKAEIVILTNGINLLKMDDEFWDECRNCRVEISVTKYPINLNFEKMYNVAKEKGVMFSFYNNTEHEKKTSYKEPIDLAGKQNAQKMYDYCSRAHCYTCKNGKLYHCTFIPSVDNFIAYFGKQLIVTEDDYVDIYKINSAEEGDRKLAKYSQFCRYCNVLHNEFGLKWERSSKNIKEWI
jgi:hypothetical protein